MSTISIANSEDVFDLLRDDLAAIEHEFERQSASEVEVITDIARYLMAGGGKRIRPLLLLLSAKALGCTSQSRIRLGAVVEMLHTATLVHDDIIDEADTRRGRPSANTTWGNSKCVLSGDWLYMQSVATASSKSATSAFSNFLSPSPSRWSRGNYFKCRSSVTLSTKKSTST